MKKLLVAVLVLLSLFSIVSAHEVFVNLVGNIKVELTPNYLSPITGANFTAFVDLTDLNSDNGIYTNYNVKIYNETAQIFEITNLTTAPAKISSFSYVFSKEGNYFILIEIPGKGQADFPVFARVPNISGLIAVIIGGVAALIGYFVGRVNLLKPIEEEIKVLEGKKKKPRKS